MVGMEFFRDAIRKTLEEENPMLVAQADQRWGWRGGGAAADAAAAAAESDGVSSALSSSPPAFILANRDSGQTISVFTCKKLCAICFLAGAVFGFTLKQRVRRLADKILKYLTD